MVTSPKLTARIQANNPDGSSFGHVYVCNDAEETSVEFLAGCIAAITRGIALGSFNIDEKAKFLIEVN